MTSTPAKTKYYEAVGRRKTAVARVRLFPEAKTSYDLNGKSIESYFPMRELQMIAAEAFAEAKSDKKFRVSARIVGGGVAAQAEALRLGIARALTVYDAGLRGKLKKAGFLSRDPRAKERRKFGLKKARKSPQWSKR